MQSRNQNQNQNKKSKYKTKNQKIKKLYDQKIEKTGNEKIITLK